MPVVFREGGLRFFFYSNEGSPRERLHVHVRSSGGEAKIWLEPELSIADSFGFNAKELAFILRLAGEHRAEIEAAWHEHFGDRSSF
jgi:hypothetical protein